MTIKKNTLPIIGQFILIGLMNVLLFAQSSSAKNIHRDYYALKIYTLKNAAQQARVENYLQFAYLPALHRAGIPDVGVFEPVTPDSSQLKIYVFIPFRKFREFENLNRTLTKDATYQAAGKDYIDAPYNDLPYERIQTILLRAFPGMPHPAVPQLTAEKTQRVYELRSYENPTEKYHLNKFKMFNTGDEIGLFKRLGFHAAFYAEVLAGSRMPNLMYMTTFNNKQDRDNHWKIFSSDPYWKKLSGMAIYQNNVSRAEITFLHPTSFSDF
ncbi:MAG: NIPSNAP family protein [Chitinophagaceae bacterium]